MQQDMQVVDKLNEMIDTLLGSFKILKEQNNEMSREFTTLKALNEAKDAQIAKLEEKLMQKEVETNDIVKKIEAVIGR